MVSFAQIRWWMRAKQVLPLLEIKLKNRRPQLATSLRCDVGKCKCRLWQIAAFARGLASTLLIFRPLFIAVSWEPCLWLPLVFRVNLLERFFRLRLKCCWSFFIKWPVCQTSFPLWIPVVISSGCELVPCMQQQKRWELVSAPHSSCSPQRYSYTNVVLLIIQTGWWIVLNCVDYKERFAGKRQVWLPAAVVWLNSVIEQLPPRLIFALQTSLQVLVRFCWGRF